MKEATIHFTDTNVFVRNENQDIIAATAEIKETFLNVYGCTLIDSEQEKEYRKLRLEAVIQKEAEEKYPLFKKEEVKNASEHFGDYLRRGQNDRNKKFQREYISWWQSLLSRLPSEGGEKAATEYAEKENSAYTNDLYGFIEGAKWERNRWLKLLPSLPSSLMCEYEEENGKVTVTKLKLK